MTANTLLFIGGQNFLVLILCLVAAIYFASERKWTGFSVFLALAVVNGIAIYFRLLAQ